MDLISPGNLQASGGAASALPLLARAIESAGDAILITDPDHRIVWANRAFSRLSGFGPDEVVGSNCKFLLGQTDEQAMAAGGPHGVSRRELVRRHRDGTMYVAEETVTSLHDPSGAITHFVSVLHDVTQSAATLKHERLRARQDALTGLASRAHILDLLSAGMAHAQQCNHILALLFIDLDGFKSINDLSGHHVGDAVLQAAASRIQGAVRCSDTVARYGGDEFLILLPCVSGSAVAERIALDVVDQLAQPISVGAERYYLSASVGAAFCPENGVVPEALLINADGAMYRAKRAGGNQIRVAGQVADADARKIG